MQKIEQERILYEDNHLIVINKLPSEIVQGDKTGDAPLTESVKTYIKEKYNKSGNVFLGLVHRLDRPVSGIVIFARTSKALTRMNDIFKQRQIDKKYWAIVKNKPPLQEGTLEHYLLRNQKQNKSYAFSDERAGSKRALLHYKTIGKTDSFYLLEITLETGRHHQIRAQLSAINCPIKGDLKYGYPRSNLNASISLHAVAVSFNHPIKDEQLRIIANPPMEKLWQLFEPNSLLNV